MRIQEKADKQAKQKIKQAEINNWREYEREKEGEIKSGIRERLQTGCS